jgi:hypothetical protein
MTKIQIETIKALRNKGFFSCHINQIKEAYKIVFGKELEVYGCGTCYMNAFREMVHKLIQYESNSSNI